MDVHKDTSTIWKADSTLYTQSCFFKDFTQLPTPNDTTVSSYKEDDSRVDHKFHYKKNLLLLLLLLLVPFLICGEVEDMAVTSVWIKLLT